MSGADTAHRNHLDALFRAHYRWLCTYLRRYLHDSAGAEDIAAETFAQLLQAPSITAIREPRAMLTTIAQRFFISAGAGRIWSAGMRSRSTSMSPLRLKNSNN